MPLLPLDIPSGMYANGTDLNAMNRWRDGNLVRWQDKALRPIGGWEVGVEDDFIECPRGALAYAFSRDVGEQALFVGNDDGLYGVVTGQVSNNTFASGLVGYRDQTVDYYASTWSLDNFGDVLLAVQDSTGDLFAVADPQDSSTTAVVANAPDNIGSMVVTDERFVMVLLGGGKTGRGEPAKVQWSDRESYTTWAPTATNEAGDYTIQTSGRLLQAVRVRGQTLILSDRDAHSATYVGPPFVYSIERVGSSCGAISRKAAANAAVGAFWMGVNGFFGYSSGAVTKLDCPVEDVVFQNINKNQASKVWAFDNSEFNEIWWFYPTGTEPNRYVTYNYETGDWSYGQLTRTTGTERGVFEKPFLFATDGTAYTHETGYDYGEDTPYAETGPIMLGAGDRLMSVVSLYPDEQTEGDVQATFKTRNYPNGPETSHGPFSLDDPTDVRFTGRQVRMRVTGNNATDWRVGINRLDVRQRGTR